MIITRNLIESGRCLTRVKLLHHGDQPRPFMVVHLHVPLNGTMFISPLVTVDVTSLLYIIHLTHAHTRAHKQYSTQLPYGINLHLILEAGSRIDDSSGLSIITLTTDHLIGKHNINIEQIYVKLRITFTARLGHNNYPH